MNTVVSLLKAAHMLGACTLQTVRYASKKAGGSCRNRKQAPGKNLGIRKKDGDHVLPRTLIVKQNRFRYFPGLNAVLYGNHHIRALKSGVVRITGELSDMDFNNSMVAKEFGAIKGAPIYKKYINVIPYPQHQRFKLVNQV